MTVYLHRCFGFRQDCRMRERSSVMQEHQGIVVVVRHQPNCIFGEFIKVSTYKPESIKVCSFSVVCRSNLIDYYAAVKTSVAAKSDIPQTRTLLLELLSSNMAMMSVPLLAMVS